MKRWFAVILVGSALLSGCDPRVSVTGSVRSGDGHPVAGVAISVECPPDQTIGHRIDPGTTDGQGRFSLEGIGCLPKVCTVVAKYKEVNAATVSASAVCQRTVRFLCSPKDYCNFVSADLVILS